MSEYMFELKPVKYIIDNSMDASDAAGFKLINHNEISSCGIDGVIISSYKFKVEILKNMSESYPEIDCLDIYAELAKYNILLSHEFYADVHPYTFYHDINELRNNIKSGIGDSYERFSIGGSTGERTSGINR